MATKYHSSGSVVKWAAGGALAVVGSVESFDGPGPETQFFDGTALDSGNVIEDGEQSGQSAPGDFSASVFCDLADAVHSLIVAAVVDPARVYESVEITAPDGVSTITMAGTTKSFKPKASAKDAFKADWSFKGRTLPVYA